MIINKAKKAIVAAIITTLLLTSMPQNAWADDSDDLNNANDLSNLLMGAALGLAIVVVAVAVVSKNRKKDAIPSITGEETEHEFAKSSSWQVKPIVILSTGKEKSFSKNNTFHNKGQAVIVGLSVEF